MSRDLLLLWAIQIAPLAAFLKIQLMPKGLRHRFAPLVGAGGALLAAASAVTLFVAHIQAHHALEYSTKWLQVNERLAFSAGFLLDPLNLVMITVVTVISFFVQVFSAYYMADDASRGRYFGFLSFFSFSMTGLVLSSNLLQTFFFWELVGLASYLLIGFYYEKRSAGTAARKAFVLNRLADLGFYLGVILLFLRIGTLDFTKLTAPALQAALSPEWITILGLLVFTGVMGKSAQFPFHAWLPDAMEGPTPVSALIHSATMVAAGVFLLARSFDLFSASATTLSIVLVFGALTAFTGAALATIQRDIKRILAYSTVSQLGLMVMGIGAGAAFAGMFHLVTHAFFKSLLFLTSGAFIHRFHTNDIWEIGRKGGKKDALAMTALFVGLASLSGVFPFAGFFSKDMILEVLKERNLFFFGVAVFVSLLTVYYSCRMFFVILWSKPEPAKAAHGHGHDSHAHAEPAYAGAARAIPLVSLAVLSLAAGYLGSPFSGAPLIHWLGGHGAHFDPFLIAVTAALVLGGAAWGFLAFRSPEAAEKRLEASRHPVKLLLDRKLFVDDAFALVHSLSLKLSAAFDAFDRWFVNGVMVNGTSFRILDLGKIAARLQSGQLQDYAALAVGIAAAILLMAVSR